MYIYIHIFTYYTTGVYPHIPLASLSPNTIPQAQDSWAMVGLSGRLEDLCRDLRRSVESPGHGSRKSAVVCPEKKRGENPQIFR